MIEPRLIDRHEASQRDLYLAVVDALLTVHNANGPDGTIIPAIPVIFFYVAVRHADRWLIQDGRTHFAAAPPSNMTKSGVSQN